MKKYFVKKYGVFCPECSLELNWYAGMSSKSNVFKCLNCNKYFLKETDKQEFTETDIGQGINNLLQNDPDQKWYQGTPSSTYFAPKWLYKFLKK
jgi:hypothetical protein